jgi:hypothetical protein
MDSHHRRKLIGIYEDISQDPPKLPSAKLIKRARELEDMILNDLKENSDGFGNTIVSMMSDLVNNKTTISSVDKRLKSPAKVEAFIDDEFDTLINAVTWALAEQEEGRGSAFTKDNIVPVALKAMEELYEGKDALYKKHSAVMR